MSPSSQTSYPFSLTSRGSGSRVSGGVRGQQELKGNIGVGPVNLGNSEGWVCIQAPGELPLHLAVRVANQACLPLVDFIIQNG